MHVTLMTIIDRNSLYVLKEWLISTPRHVALYNAFGWEHPQFAHVGLLVDQKKQKLSKRFGSFNLSSWKEKGILPIALLNYVLLLGWSPSRDSGERSEIMNMNDMIQKVIYILTTVFVIAKTPLTDMF